MARNNFVDVLRWPKDMSLSRRLIVISIILAISQSALSQMTVTGTVISKGDQSSIHGVNVVEKGTQNGTTTNFDGTFSLTVANPNSILIFSFIGMITMEYSLNGQRQIFIEMKSDCNKDFFDSNQISINTNSGVINNPVGGATEISSPGIMGGIVKVFYSYQTNLKENEFRNGQVELSHFVGNCDFDMDFKWHHRSFSFNNALSAHAQSFETDLNLHGKKIIAGYSHLNLNTTETMITETSPGVLIGFGVWLGRPLYSIWSSKVSFYKNHIEYQSNIQGGYRNWVWFLKYYKLNEFNELSLGGGWKFYYRIKRKK